ncbi:MAG TPA: hypothetical protein VGK59_23860 [Ohtaekwangia sp.]
MKTIQIHYSKVFSLGNYENEKIGVEIEIQEGDDVQKAIQQARQFVEFNHKLNGLNLEFEQCERVVNNPDDFTGQQVKRAKERMEQIHNSISEGTKLLN